MPLRWMVEMDPGQGAPSFLYCLDYTIVQLNSAQGAQAERGCSWVLVVTGALCLGCPGTWLPFKEVPARVMGVSQQPVT